MAVEARAERTGARTYDSRRSDPWKVAFMALLVVGLLAVVTWVLLGSRLLVVRQVEVSGLDRLARDEVVAAAAIATGTPLARVDVDAVAARVAGLRLTESVEVARGWPATLRIRVVERTPVVGIRVDHGYLLVDRDGVLVEDSESRPAGYPLVRLQGEVEGNPAIADAARIIEELPRTIADEVDDIEASDPATITFGLAGGVTVLWGDSERGANKARVLEALMERHPPQKGRRYDVSAAGVAVVK